MRELPFGLTPNTRFYVDLPGHREALNVILVALRSGEGFVRITGEVGSGKTLLCRRLLRELGPAFVSAYVPDPFLSPLGLRKALAAELGIQFPHNVDSHRLLKRIREVLVEAHASGRSTVLLVDEAQALSRESLEGLRLLTNLETETAKLLQVVLFGQPELEARLRAHSLRQLAQRITFAHRLPRLDRERTVDYVTTRLTSAGRAGGDLFSRAALGALHRASGGIPRRINVLGHKALMAAYGRGDARVRWRHVRSAVVDTPTGSLRQGRRPAIGREATAP